MLGTLASSGLSQTPFIDGAFSTISPDDDPDLIIARELYDPISRIQSIYLRFHDGTMDREILSGTISLTGATITSVLVDHQSLKESDQTWGIDGVVYGLGRGLEGVVTETAPDLSSDEDLVLTGEDTLRFWFSTSDDIDDLRILVRYPEEHQAAELQVVLWHLRGRDEEGYPVTTPGRNGETGGIIVGHSTGQDLCTDDGDYGEITSIGRIRLKTEDLDVRESVIDLGTVDHQGGVLGPAPFHIENFLNAIDIDSDNDPDSNGSVDPVPSHGDLRQLQVLSSDLESPAGHRILHEQSQVLGIPNVIPNGELGQVLYSIEVPPNTPMGQYTGYLLVWEDNDQSGALTDGEPRDTIELRLSVEASLLPDVGPFPADMSPTSDLGVADMGIDQSVPADQSVEADAQGGSLDGTLADMNTDGMTTDATPPIDGFVADGGQTGDSEIVDQSMMQQTDIQISGADRGTDQNVPTGDEAWGGTPSGGSFQCHQSSSLPLWSFMLLALVGIRGRP